MNRERVYDVLVAGAGCGGICAGVQAARQGARVLLVEKADEIGGTGVHSPVALVCKFQRRDTLEPINLGLHRELFPESYAWRGEFDDEDLFPSYDHWELARRYAGLIAAEPKLLLRTACGVDSVVVQGDGADRRIVAAQLDDGSQVTARTWIDATGDGVLGVLAGAQTMTGRPGDGAMQAATLTFAVTGFDRGKLANPAITTWGGYRSLNAELAAVLGAVRRADPSVNGHFNTGCFPYPDGRTLLFNNNHVFGVDPFDRASVDRGHREAEALVAASFAIVRRHPAFADARIAFVSPKLGVREGRRIVGDHVLTGEECLGEARFSDCVAAGAYDIDIHEPDGGPATMRRIPNTQYYHIPYRSLRVKGLRNLLMGSRCLSGDFVAHSSYRVMSTITAVGQAAGCAAALAVRHAGGDVRGVDPAWIRYELDRAGQWTEGTSTTPVFTPPPGARTSGTSAAGSPRCA